MSFVTGIIGGIQSAHAAKDAAKERAKAAQAAGDIYGQSVADANPILDAAYNAYAPQQIEAATNAGNQVNDAAEGAATNILDAVKQGNAYYDTYLNGGKDAYASLQQLINGGFQKFDPGDFQADPSYAFRQAEAQKAIERSAAAKGGAMGGASLKAITRYSQDAASQEYQNWYNRQLSTYNANRSTDVAKASTLGQLVNLGASAADRVASNTIGGTSMANNYRTTAATYGANAMLDANTRVGAARLSLGQMQANNIIGAGDAKANAMLAQGEAQAQGHLGAAAGWNQMWSGIGAGVDSAISGGFGGGGGFSLGGMVRGMAGMPRRRVGTPGNLI